VALRPPSRTPRALAAARASLVRRLITARSFSASAAYRCSMNGSVSAPSSATMEHSPLFIRREPGRKPLVEKLKAWLAATGRGLGKEAPNSPFLESFVSFVCLDAIAEANPDQPNKLERPFLATIFYWKSSIVR